MDLYADVARLEQENEQLKKLIREHAEFFKRLDKEVGGVPYFGGDKEKIKLREFFEFNIQIAKCEELAGGLDGTPR